MEPIEPTPREGTPLTEEQISSAMGIDIFSRASESKRILSKELDAANKEAIAEIKPFLEPDGTAGR